MKRATFITQSSSRAHVFFAGIRNSHRSLLVCIQISERLAISNYIAIWRFPLVFHFGGYIVVAVGYSDDYVSLEIEIFEPVSNTWRYLAHVL